MINKLNFFVVGLFVLTLMSCDKVDNPYENQVTIDIDTTLFPGVWADYTNNEYPTFPDNTNTDINVLIEDYTGHKCNNCPDAAEIAHTIHENNPNRIFVASIHVDPGAQLSFQETESSGSYTTDHTNPDAVDYGETFQNGFNFIGNPQGTVNRKTVDGKMLSIPNAEILNSTVASYTNFPNLRIDIAFTVASNENLRKIREVLFQLVENNNDYLLPPSPKVVLNKMNDYNIELIFQVWIKNEKKHIDLRNDLREQVFKTLTQNDIDMPYETVSVIMNNK
jgi:hypothetical protein